MYCVVPAGAMRFLSKALEASRWTPCVQMVPTVRVVLKNSSRWISRLDSRTYGIRNPGSTILRFVPAPNELVLVREFGNTGAC